MLHPPLGCESGPKRSGTTPPSTRSFRFDPETEEVEIRREGKRVILEPVAREGWPEEFWQAFGDMPEGFDRPPRVRQVREDLEP